MIILIVITTSNHDNDNNDKHNTDNNHNKTPSSIRSPFGLRGRCARGGVAPPGSSLPMFGD